LGAFAIGFIGTHDVPDIVSSVGLVPTAKDAIAKTLRQPGLICIIEFGEIRQAGDAVDPLVAGNLKAGVSEDADIPVSGSFGGISKTS
jgi:hypothetical protein